jgi:hypothetical protein
MQATSTPTLAQPKSGAFAALGGAAILAAAVGVGAILGVNLASSGAATAGNDANVAAYALKVQRSGEMGALTPAQRGLLLQRQGEINAGAAAASTTFTTPTGTVVRIGGRDGQGAFNEAPLLSASDLIRGSKGWYAYAPVDATVPYPGPMYPPVVIQNPATNLSDYFDAKAGWAGDVEGNDTPVGTSHR